MSFAQELRAHFYELGQHFPGFEEVLTQALFALVGEEHILWYSKPGRAKSMVAKAIFSMFDGAETFTKQLTKDMLPESVFGNVIPDELMAHGKEIYNLDGGIVTCEFAYLDEFFDASDYVLRSLLNVLNEREFHSKDMGTVKAPLHTAITTTNFMRQREATEAVLDRLICKANINGIEEVSDCMRAGQTYLGYAGKTLPLGKLQYGDLKQLADFVQSPDGIVISPGMRLLHIILVHEFQRRRLAAATKSWHDEHKDAAEEPTEADLGVVEISPRTLVKLHDLSRAAAALNDRSEVVYQDQRALGYGIYVVNDESGDDVIWHQLCDEYLDFSDTQLRSLERLGEIADAVGVIKSERSQVTGAEMTVGGKLVQMTALEARNLVDHLSGARHPVLEAAKKELGEEVDALTTKPEYGRFDLIKGWE